MTRRKPRRGRPPLANPADETVRLRVTSAMLSSWRAAADRAGLTLSEWLREAAERYRANAHTQTPTPAAPRHA